MGARFTAWVEADPVQCERLRAMLPRLNVIECAVAEAEGIAIFNTFTISGCNSILEQAEQEQNVLPVGKMMVPTRTIDNLIKDWPFNNYEMLVLDIQGAELRALKGATEFLKAPDLKYIYTECYNEPKYYKGACTAAEIVEYLAPFGFELASVDPENDVANNYLFKR